MDAQSTVDDRSLSDPRRKGFRLRATVAEVLATIDARVNRLTAQEIPLTEAAGRVLAHDVVAAEPVPPFDRAAMDGLALRGEETLGADPYAPAVFHVVGLSGPGRPMTGRVGPGEAAEIATGSHCPRVPMPSPRSKAAVQVDRVRIFEPVPPGRHVGRRGEDLEVSVRRWRGAGCCDRKTSAS